MDIYINFICGVLMGGCYTIAIYNFGAMKGMRDARRIYQRAFNSIFKILQHRMEGELETLLIDLQQPRNEQPTKH